MIWLLVLVLGCLGEEEERLEAEVQCEGYCNAYSWTPEGSECLDDECNTLRCYCSTLIERED